MSALAVVGLSARAMAEAASREGFDVIALDLFGDADTRAVASRWWPIGEPDALRIDADALLAALGTLAARGDVSGWIAGSGFDGRPGLLADAGQRLPLIGTSPAAVRLVRDPQRFFATLDAAGIAHPEVRHTPFDEGEPAEGWLLKDGRGCGGWQVSRPAHADDIALGQGRYLQREAPGRAMSATFVGHGSGGSGGHGGATVLGFNRLLTRRFGRHPFVFCGAIGPVAVPPSVERRVHAAVDMLADAFDLRGLCSLDFLLDGDDVRVLEINPRVPATIALYPDACPIRAHLHACGPRVEREPASTPIPGVRGFEIVFARHALRVDARAAAVLGDWPRCHDKPFVADVSGASFEPGDPLCTLSAQGDDADSVQRALNADVERLLDTLESLR